MMQKKDEMAVTLILLKMTLQGLNGKQKKDGE
jgi:hypothetical protein